jgi:fucose 4-O-acetylase-like acetyltransferase
MMETNISNMNITSHNRIVWIDWAKTLLIYLMVVGHCLFQDIQHLYIYAFHMPAFFLISGLLYHQHNWWKTLKSFMIPIIFFSLMNLVVYLIPKMIHGALDTSNFLYRSLIPYVGGNIPENLDYIYLFPGVWFLFALMMCRFMIGDIKIFSPLLKYRYVTLIILLIFLIFEPFLFKNNPFQSYKIYRALPALPFVLFGYIMKEKIHIDKINIWLVLLALLIFSVTTYFQGECNILSYKFGISYIVFYLNAIMGSLVLFYICTKLKGSKVIQVLSKGTILILAVQFNLIIFCRIIFTKMGIYSSISETLFPWISGIIVLAICYYPIKFLLKHCPILLGK